MNLIPRASVLASLVVLIATPVLAADAAAPASVQVVKPAASAVVGKAPPSNKTAPATVITGKNGDNQYPSTAVTPPKPPKKEALEATGALKAKTGQ